MLKAYCFLSKKGGVGKTTLTLNCAHALAFSGFRTLLVDADGQANLSRQFFDVKAEAGAGRGDITGLLMGRAAADEVIRPTHYENLDLICGSVNLEDLPLLDPKIIREPARLKNALQSVLDDYDFVLFDCPPAWNWLSRLVLYSSEAAVVPVQAEPFAVQGLRDLALMLSRMSATAQLYRIVINMYRSNTQLHQAILQEIETEFPGKVARQKIRLTIQLAEAAHAGRSVFEYAPASIGALDLYSLCFELFQLSPERVRAAAESLKADALTLAASKADD